MAILLDRLQEAGDRSRVENLQRLLSDSAPRLGWTRAQVAAQIATVVGGRGLSPLSREPRRRSPHRPPRAAAEALPAASDRRGSAQRVRAPSRYARACA